MENQIKSEQCPGCHAIFAPADMGTDRYRGACSGCWAAFNQVLAKEYQDYPDYQQAHRLTVDAYGVQHPGSPQERNAVQSVNIHLIALHLSIVENRPVQYVVRCMAKILDRKRDFVWLTPPANPHWLTVQDVIKAQTPEEHLKIVKAWAISVYNAWSDYHTVIKDIIIKSINR